MIQTLHNLLKTVLPIRYDKTLTAFVICTEGENKADFFCLDFKILLDTCKYMGM